MASKKKGFKDKRFRSLATALGFYGLSLISLDSGYVDDWISGDCGGKERWDIKTLADDASEDIDLTRSEFTDIRTIAAIKPGFNPRLKAEKDRHPLEEKLFTITCRIKEVLKQDDEDLHLVLSDGTRTMVGEIVFPCCPDVKNGDHAALFKRAFQQFDPFRAGHAWEDHTWQVTGVAFVDYKHGGKKGQKGMLANCIELHPIVDIHPID